jgi:putative spermidine/putrescine transport system ATP-binding protein
VAEFVGLTNRLAGEVRDGEVEVRGTRLPLVQPNAANGPAIALVRPEAVSLTTDGDAPGPLVGTVIAVSFLGALSRVTVDLGDDVIVLAQLPTSEASAHQSGSRVRLAIRKDPVLIARDETTAAEV